MSRISLGLLQREGLQDQAMHQVYCIIMTLYKYRVTRSTIGKVKATLKFKQKKLKRVQQCKGSKKSESEIKSKT